MGFELLGIRFFSAATIEDNCATLLRLSLATFDTSLRLGKSEDSNVRYLASLQDACDPVDRYPVVSSLRSSTTGYYLSSLQLDLASVAPSLPSE